MQDKVRGCVDNLKLLKMALLEDAPVFWDRGIKHIDVAISILEGLTEENLERIIREGGGDSEEAHAYAILKELCGGAK